MSFTPSASVAPNWLRKIVHGLAGRLLWRDHDQDQRRRSTRTHHQFGLLPPVSARRGNNKPRWHGYSCQRLFFGALLTMIAPRRASTMNALSDGFLEGTVLQTRLLVHYFRRVARQHCVLHCTQPKKKISCLPPRWLGALAQSKRRSDAPDRVCSRSPSFLLLPLICAASLSVSSWY